MTKLARVVTLVVIFIIVIGFVAKEIKPNTTTEEYPRERIQLYHLQNAYKTDNYVVVMLYGPLVVYWDQISPNTTENKVRRVLHTKNIPEMNVGQEYLYVVYKYSFGNFNQDYLVKIILFNNGDIYLKKIDANQGPSWIRENGIIWEYAWITWLECSNWSIETGKNGNVRCKE